LEENKKLKAFINSVKGRESERKMKKEPEVEKERRAKKKN
jgi:hypothetical protein